MREDPAASAAIRTATPDSAWDGQTYYQRPQLKPAPFNNWLVGGYVFLAGLSGAAQLLATVLDLRRRRSAAGSVRRGRYLAMLAPTIGTLCLVCDLHTPGRFYNMLRVFKATSPMSLGSWTLVGFSATSTFAAAAQFAADRSRSTRWLPAIARMAQLPAAVFGSVLATYTAALFSATSTPRWAAAPGALAMRFAAASVASAAAALSIGAGRRRGRLGRELDGIALAALATELAATLAAEETEQRAGLREPGSGGVEPLTVALPLGLFALSLLLPGRRSRSLSALASIATLAASLGMRISVMHRGDQSASQPELSLRFTEPARPSDGPAGQFARSVG